MPKAPKSAYYAVRLGRVPGIYHSWADCEAQVKGFTGAAYKKLATEAEAVDFMAAKSSAVQTSSASQPPKAPEAALPTAEDEKDCDIVYCDGACKGNGQANSIAGIGVWWGHGDPRNISERCPGDQTNNRAELIAIVRILETTPHLKRRLLIKTDSHYSIQCVTAWIFNWMRNGFRTSDGKPVKNCALIKYLAALLHARRKTSQTVEFKHVRGHVGIEGNEAADQLANLGATKPMIPERDWERLEKEVLQNLRPVEQVKVKADSSKVYAAGHLNNDKLAKSAGTNIGNAVLPMQESGQPRANGENPTQGYSLGYAVPHKVSTTRNRSQPESRGSSGPMVVATLLPQSVLATKIASVTNEDLEVYASCLLSDDELSTLGKDGVFDSDF